MSRYHRLSDNDGNMPSFKIVAAVFGIVATIVFGIWAISYQRESTVHPVCTASVIEVDLGEFETGADVKLTTPAGGMCVGDVIYESETLCSDGVTIIGSSSFDVRGEDVQFRIADCQLSVEKIERR